MFVTGLVAALVVAQPGVSVAQAAGQDSVAGFATPEFTGSIHQEYAFDVRAGPPGQAPTGNVFALVKSTDDVSRLIRNEPVCLTVNGNRATIGVKVIDPPTSVVGVLFFVEDNGGTGADRFGAVGLETVPTACPLEPTVALTPLVQGNLSIVDAARPQIASVVPAANATEVLPNVTVVVGFDSPMDKPSAEAAFSLKRTSDGTPVTGSFGWYGNALLFKPNGDLAGGTQYTASVSTAAKNLGGHPLGAAKTWRFTTTNRPIIDTVYPVDGATGVSRTSVTIATFSKAMGKPSAQAAFSLKRTSNGTPVSGSFSWYGNALIFTPNATLAAGTQYTAAVSGTAKDLAGRTLANATTWRYTTGN